LLDIGCGPSYFLYSAKEEGFIVTAIEPGIFSAISGKFRLGYTIRITDFMHFNDNLKYDITTCLHVIEHVPNPIEFAAKVIEYVSDRGLIIFATPNIGCEYAENLGSEWSACGPADHLCLYNNTTLSLVLNKAGYTDYSIIETGQHSEELIAVCKFG